MAPIMWLPLFTLTTFFLHTASSAIYFNKNKPALKANTDSGLFDYNWPW